MLAEPIHRNQHSHPPFHRSHSHTHSKEQGRAKKCRTGSRGQTDNNQHGNPQILEIIPISAIPGIPYVWSLAVHKTSS